MILGCSGTVFTGFVAAIFTSARVALAEWSIVFTDNNIRQIDLIVILPLDVNIYFVIDNNITSCRFTQHHDLFFHQQKKSKSLPVIIWDLMPSLKCCLLYLASNIPSLH